VPATPSGVLPAAAHGGEQVGGVLLRLCLADPDVWSHGVLLSSDDVLWCLEN
jgi:hypothetical protein